MMGQWFHTNTTEFCKMIGVTDERIRNCSNGEVKDPEYGTPDSLDSEKIFGEIGNGETLMGHIELPIPVVNVQYLYGKKPVLPDMLRMDRRELSDIIRNISYVVIDPGTENGLTYKQILSFEELEKLKHESEKSGDAVILSGGEAVERLLEKEGCTETDGIILRTIPVIPIDLRYKKCSPKSSEEKDCCHSNSSSDDNTCIYCYQIEQLYRRVLWRACRMKRLLLLKLPEIIRVNESRLLQEMVNDLINNGAGTPPFELKDGTPAESLQELHEYITSISRLTGRGNSRDATADEPGALNDETKEAMLKLASEYMSLLFEDDECDDDSDDDGNDSAGVSEDDAPHYHMSIEEGTEFFEKKEAYEDRFAELAKPLAEAVFNRKFSKYSDFKDGFMGAAEYGIKAALKEFRPDDSIFSEQENGTDAAAAASIEKSLLACIYANMKCYKEKRVMFEE